jgi:ABC-type phosphate transport system permease subunit
MKSKNSIIVILIVSLIGLLFSGFLSYMELVPKKCVMAGTCALVSGIPACVYGFFMYLIIFLFSICALRHLKEK